MISLIPGFVLLSVSRLLRARSGRSLHSVGIGLVVLLATATLEAEDLPPEVTACQVQNAPRHETPAPGGGYNAYTGRYHIENGFIIETDLYDPVAKRANTRFVVRRAADHKKLYSLREGSGLNAPAENDVFTDGELLAVRLRSKPGAVAHISIHDLATGARRYRLHAPDSSAPASDDFGRSIWFTADRILVAAPGRDHPKNAGALFIYDRETGKFVGAVSPAIKGLSFGNAPSSPYAIPYVQTARGHALIVHGDQLFRFYRDRLFPLPLPPAGKNRVTVTQASISQNRIVVLTAEQNAKGRTVPGRLLVFNVANGALAYQPTKPDRTPLIPAKFIARGNRLYVYDSEADSAGRGAFQIHDLASGARLRREKVSAKINAVADRHSVTLSDGLLWLRCYYPVVGGPSDTEWRGYDAQTLELRFKLVPPGDDRFVGPAPRALGGGRFAVASTRLEPISSFTSVEGARMQPLSSVIIGNPTHLTMLGLLVYSSSNDKWTHRLRLHPLEYDFDRDVYADIAVFRADTKSQAFVTTTETPEKIFRFDTTLPLPEPETTWEARLTYTPEPGFTYELLHRQSGEADFTVHSTLLAGDGVPRLVTLPYSDILNSIAYRLDGVQFSRHIVEPSGEPISLGEQALTAVAANAGRIAVRTPSSSVFGNGPGTVKILNTATGATELTLTLSSGTGTGPIALSENHVVVGRPGTQGEIDVFSAVTGQHARTLIGSRAFGSAIALSGDRLAATWVASTYASGTYTHTFNLTVYDLPSGNALFTKSLGSQTAPHAWSAAAPDVVSAGEYIAVRDGSGSVRVLDFATGDLLHELTPPDPSPERFYGAWLAADGDWLAIGDSGASEVFVYSLSSGDLKHTLILVDRPDTGRSYGTALGRLSIDGENGLLSWFSEGSNSFPRTAANVAASYVFDLGTGQEVAKVHRPFVPSSTPSLQGAILLNGELHAFDSSSSWAKYPLMEAIASTPVSTSEPLALVPVARLRFPTQAGVSYQPQISSDNGTTWTPLGDKVYGDGKRATVRLAFPPGTQPETVWFRLRTRWDIKPPITSIPFTP